MWELSDCKIGNGLVVVSEIDDKSRVLGIPSEGGADREGCRDEPMVATIIAMAGLCELVVSFLVDMTDAGDGVERDLVAAPHRVE